MNESRLSAAMRELEDAHAEQERCRQAWLTARAVDPSAIDPVPAECYCMASDAAAAAATTYHDILCEEQASALRNVPEATS